MADGRKVNGGARPGAGRKTKAEEFGLSALLDKCWTLQQRQEVIQRLHDYAMAGGKAAVGAASLLLAYAYGKPTEKHEHTNSDGSPLLQPVADAITKIYGATKSG